MNNLNSLFFLFFLLFSSLVFSQNGIVRGTIIDSDFQDPVPFANIIVKETGTGTTSDFDGNYEIYLEDGSYTLQFSYLGYKTVEISDIIIGGAEPTIINVSMEVMSQGLEEVVVTVSAKKKYRIGCFSISEKIS